jgi:hypothetical protein
VHGCEPWQCRSWCMGLTLFHCKEPAPVAAVIIMWVYLMKQVDDAFLLSWAMPFSVSATGPLNSLRCHYGCVSPSVDEAYTLHLHLLSLGITNMGPRGPPQTPNCLHSCFFSYCSWSGGWLPFC